MNGKLTMIQIAFVTSIDSVQALSTVEGLREVSQKQEHGGSL
jgi:hypothetical protein